VREYNSLDAAHAGLEFAVQSSKQVSRHSRHAERGGTTLSCRRNCPPESEQHKYLVAEIVLQRVSNINISSNIRRTTATCLPPITPASPSGRPISTPPPATPTNNEIRLGRGGQKHALLQLLCRGEGWLPPCCRMYSASSESKASCKVEVL